MLNDVKHLSRGYEITEVATEHELAIREPRRGFALVARGFIPGWTGAEQRYVNGNRLADNKRSLGFARDDDEGRSG